ncbi:malonate decarboxylase holo-ACP synthase [Marinobacterium sedimentorum]|uniref:malonate decarboxylase holo-ACP synthase n=1 Tax=Marinobacterium sedimentorum TaxID=2927804 RepID=UPI0020C71638|nr:malonate decarboxylase holo-ACP synthase [Marinobacterium sedimentorum]MCP8688398.1 malonate decarboxylase holo-ACP synthase [Marinobacterium sedimentorum]
MNWCPHDLLWVTRTDLQCAPDDSDTLLPRWVRDGQGPVVVRRERVPTRGMIAVGVRGQQKSERQAAYIARRSVATGLTPYELAASRPWLRHPLRTSHPVLQTLADLAPRLDAKDLHWGITGSLGYEFATGESQLRPESDLDLIIRAPNPLTRCEAAALLTQLGNSTCRLDIQLETPDGAIALAEWAGRSPRVMIRTAEGPRLSAEPWQPATN